MQLQPGPVLEEPLLSIAIPEIDRRVECNDANVRGLVANQAWREFVTLAAGGTMECA
jgi:hypothetical protein